MLKSLTEDSIEYEVKAVKYMNTMNDDGSVVIQTFAKIEGTGQVFSKTFICKIDDPDLEMKVNQSRFVEINFPGRIANYLTY